MRILHLVEAGRAGAGPCAMRLVAEAVRRLDDCRHQVLIVGAAGQVAPARQCGLRPAGFLPRLPAAAAAALREVLWPAGGSGGGGAIDLVHTWSPGAVAVAGAAIRAGRRSGAKAGSGPRLLVTAGAGPASPATETTGTAWLARRAARRIVASADALLALDEAAAAAWRRAGMAEDRVIVLDPAIDAAAIAAEGRALLRERWEADETIFVAGLLGEPVDGADAWQAANAAGRAALAGRNVRLVLHHGAARRRGLAQWLAPLGLSGLLIVDDDTALPWLIAPGLDAALWLHHDARPGHGGVGAAASMLPLLWAMAAGVPVVAERCPATAAILGDDRGWLVEPKSRNAAAAVILDLFDDPRERARRCAMASAWVAERYAPAAFVERLRSAYGLGAAPPAQARGRQPSCGERSRAAAPE